MVLGTQRRGREEGKRNGNSSPVGENILKMKFKLFKLDVAVIDLFVCASLPCWNSRRSSSVPLARTHSFVRKASDATARLQQRALAFPNAISQPPIFFFFFSFLFVL